MVAEGPERLAFAWRCGDCVRVRRWPAGHGGLVLGRGGLALLALVAALWGHVAAVRGADVAEFNRDIRPILADKCFACHGPDARSREAELRLDEREDAVMDRGGYCVIKPHEPQESELVARITSDDDDLRMPPADAEKQLTRQEIELLTRWIAEGAQWEDHWSLAPLVRPPSPALEDPWPRNAVDQFVLRRLRAESLDPAPPADRRALIRRLYLDVIGLPPTPAEVQAFVDDPSPDAYPQLVEQLLASPHYGERMAIYWLDLVRYADTLGYHGDQERSVSPYRDYVIRAFNENLPFDQFTIENLAGDLLPNATLAQRVASTYNRLNRASAEGGVQPKEYLAKYAADRVRTTGGVWLGSTIGCAECHDHKFDPFTTRDFYAFEAFFADIKEQGIVEGANYIELLPVPTEEQTAQLQQLNEALAATTAHLDQRDGERVEQFAQWQQQQREGALAWVALTPLRATSAAGATLEIQSDGAILAREKSPDSDVYTIELSLPPGEYSSLRLDVLPDASLPAQGPGRADNGNFVLQRLQAAVGTRPVIWSKATATHSQSTFEVEHLAQGNAKGWAVLPQVGKETRVVLAADQPLLPGRAETTGAETTGADTTLTVTMTQNHGSRHTLGHFRFYAARGVSPLTAADIVPDAIADLLRREPAARTADETEQLWQRFRQQAPQLATVREELARLEAAKSQVEKAIVTTLATSAGEPRVTRVLPRGNWMDESGEVVVPAVPHFLSQPEVSGRLLNRLDLARWMVARENPLTARTLVNRMWMLFFGQGICRSVDDLGSQGQWPTHPDLLDWLAVEFIESGWDVKHLVRLLVLSNTYCQSSHPRDALRVRDPYNKLLARQARWRLDAEFVRDNALSVSGLLDLTIGGRSARPYQPAGYWDQLNFPQRTYQQDTGPNQYRRGVYTHWQRTFLHPSLLAFDAPVREECTARRDRSNTPLQALVLMNDPTYVEAARVLAAGALQADVSGERERLEWLFQQVLQRAPTSQEQDELLAFSTRNRSVYEQAPAAASQLMQVGLAPVPSDLEQVELATWTCVARVLLNLHETITRY